MVFDDAAAAAEFCRDSPLEMFVVSFVPVSPPPPVESEADFLKRLHRMVAEGEAKRAPVTPAEADELPRPGADVAAWRSPQRELSDRRGTLAHLRKDERSLS